MLLERDGSQWSGYVATGFFAGEPYMILHPTIFQLARLGITLGRILLLPINKMVSERAKKIYRR